MILGFTGHRPDKIGGEWNHTGPCSNLVQHEIKKVLLALAPSQFVCGLAQGGDIHAAIVALDLKIPLTAALPFEGQDNGWEKEARNLYARILAHPLTTKKVVSPGGPHTSKYHIRNRWIVDQLKGADDVLLSLWDHSESGGTSNTVKYAKQQGKKMVNIDPRVLLKDLLPTRKSIGFQI